MVDTGRLRARPFAAAEVALVALAAAGGAAWVGVVLADAPGAWPVANGTLGAAGLLAVVLAAHGVRDLARLFTEDGWPGSLRLATVGAVWRLLELVLAVAVTLGGLLIGSLVADAGAVSNEDAAGTLGVIVAVSLLVEAAMICGLVLLVVARVVATGGDAGGETTGESDDPATASR